MSLLRFQHRQISVATLGILFTLLLGCPPARPAHAQESHTTLVFYAQSKVSEDLWPLLFQILRSDLASGAGELPNGLVLDRRAAFVRGTDDLRGILFSKVISVKLLGRCDVLPQTNHPSSRGPLGWVPLVSGKIQPFVSIDCTRLAQVLRPAAAGLDKQARQDMMAQAIAHVLIHEWSHIVTQSTAHSSRGITQAYLSVNDLIEEPKNNHLSAANH
ncbi:MAG TPA: hypothetical protein VFE27_25930 [Acidobacteriaceae bacterium]|jgi:hypothetical protein|nr:hypothetical protein [Acidobacteriaceae bacterium]